MVWIVTIPVAGVLLWINWERLRGQHLLRQWERQAQESGEVLAVNLLSPDRAPPVANVAGDLARFWAKLESAPSRSMQPPGPPLMTLQSDGTATAGWRMSSWTNSSFLGEATENDWTDLSPLVDRYGGDLDRTSAAIREGTFDSGVQYGAGFEAINVPHTTINVAVKTFSQWLNARTLGSLRERDLGEAAADIQTLATLVHLMRDEHLILTQMIRMSVAESYCKLIWEALQQTGWTDAQLASIQHAIARNDFIEPMHRSVQMERAMTRIDFCRLRGSKEFIRRQIEENAIWNDFFAHPLGHGSALHVNLWLIAWSHHDELNSMRTWDAVLDVMRDAKSTSWADAVKRMDHSPSRFAIEDGYEHLGPLNRWRFLFSAPRFSISEGLVSMTLQRQTFQEMAVTAIALERFRLKHKRLPQNLDALVPGFLEAPPKDWMDGKVLKYRLRRPDAYKLYSSGSDGIDDGGAPERDQELEDEFGYSSIWHGRDALWPPEASKAPK